MYKCDYTKDDFMAVADESVLQIKELLQERYDKLEEMRKAINDRYPFDDLFVQWAKVDYEEKIINTLIKHLESFVKEIKKEISEQYHINQKK